jgi:hypothetical protein
MARERATGLGVHVQALPLFRPLLVPQASARIYPFDNFTWLNSPVKYPTAAPNFSL